MEYKISANIFFCKRVNSDKGLLNIEGVFTQSIIEKESVVDNEDFEIVVNTIVNGNSTDLKKSIYIILEGDPDNKNEILYKMLKELPLANFSFDSYGTAKNLNVFKFNNRNLIKDAGIYKVRVYESNLGLSISELTENNQEKEFIGEQILIVKEK